MRRAGLLLVLAGCGKIGFESIARNDAGDLQDGDAAVCPMDPAPSAAKFTATVTGASQFAGSCGGDMSPELRIPFDVPDGGGTVVLSADGNNEDTVVYVASSCEPAGQEISCDRDDGVANGAELVQALPGGRYWAFLDGQKPNASLPLDAELFVELPEGGTCSGTGVPAYWRCGPDLVCLGNRCAPMCAAPTGSLQGGLTYTRNGATSGTSRHAGSCGDAGDGGRRAPEDMYILSLPTAVTSVEASTDDTVTNFDTLIYMRAGCNGAEVGCNDDVAVGTNFSSRFVTGALAAGDYYVFVDGFGFGSGNYRLSITITP